MERQGGAQGLVEVLVALGSPRLEEGLETEVFGRVHDSDARAREGAMWALVFLPSALDRVSMLVFLDLALGCALDALGDEAEPVRDAAHRAGRVRCFFLAPSRADSEHATTGLRDAVRGHGSSSGLAAAGARSRGPELASEVGRLQPGAQVSD